jgi:hypothetical protein
LAAFEGKVKTKAVIQHVPGKRQKIVDTLIANLNNPYVIECDGRPMETYRRCLLVAGDTGALMFEDDAFLCRDFEGKAKPIIEKYGDNVINFFARRRVDGTGVLKQAASSFNYNVGYWLPPGVGAKMADYIDVWPGLKDNPTGFDFVVRDWMMDNGRFYWLTVPSLVQHCVGKSLIGGGGRPRDRRSKTFRYENNFEYI